MRDQILRAVDMRKIYGSGTGAFEALRGVSLNVAAGESIAVVGKSGSGKSTLMHILALMDTPTSGQVYVDGSDTGQLGARELNRLRNQMFGFVFQQFFLTPNQTVLDNVVLPMKIARVPRSQRRRRGMEVLEQLELSDKANSLAVNLSGGQKQRAAMARALVNGPQVIFADEPTGNLDSMTGVTVANALFGLNSQAGITLVIVTHDSDLADRCQRQVVIKDGLIVDREGVAQ